MLFVLHSGQTGVERGAHDAAVRCGLGIAGFMPREERDELGPLPVCVAQRLTPHPEKGQRPALRANLSIASAVAIVVPDAAAAERFPALLWVIQGVRSQRLPLLICDPTTTSAEVESWLGRIPTTCGSQRIAVTGPRATRWSQGEEVARRIVCAFASVFGDDLCIGARGETTFASKNGNGVHGASK